MVPATYDAGRFDCCNGKVTSVRLRQAVRALVLDEDDNALLVHFHWPGLKFEDGFWACPGGGNAHAHILGALSAGVQTIPFQGRRGMGQ